MMPGTMNPGEIPGEGEGGLCSPHPFWVLNLRGVQLDTLTEFQSLERLLLC